MNDHVAGGQEYVGHQAGGNNQAQQHKINDNRIAVLLKKTIAQGVPLSVDVERNFDR